MNVEFAGVAPATMAAPLRIELRSCRATGSLAAMPGDRMARAGRECLYIMDRVAAAVGFRFAAVSTRCK